MNICLWPQPSPVELHNLINDQCVVGRRGTPLSKPYVLGISAPQGRALTFEGRHISVSWTLEELRPSK